MIRGCDLKIGRKKTILTELEVHVESESDERGYLGMNPDIPPGWLSTSVKILLSSNDADHEKLRAIAENVYRLSPVNDSVRRAVPMEVVIEVR
ncbi:MAG: OsmC family protein [Anaerolineales bacterium]|nr:OsmC family protein [Anaerolineales bacterium]